MSSRKHEYTNDENETVDKYHLHEACDRSHMMASMFEEFLLHHTAVRSDKKAMKQAQKIMDRLCKFYQTCAELSLNS